MSTRASAEEVAGSQGEAGEKTGGIGGVTLQRAVGCSCSC